jgi:2-C-methyl-D-erythritol 2,4-cyclodiphosphate synthase
MNEPAIVRVGIGTDLHRLVAGKRLVLGGVDVPFELGLHGHSDADVVLHALIDALLGAAGMPDIGEHFPDHDPKYADADSRSLLRDVLRDVKSSGYLVVNVDLVISAEQPKLSPHKTAIRASIAGLLGVKDTRVSVKAKTGEGLDAVGRGEAIGCVCVVGLGLAGQ